MFRYPSFILQGSLDCYPIDARMKLHAKSFFFRLIRAFFRPAARLDTGSMYRSALSFNIKDRIPRSPLSGIVASLRPATSIQYPRNTGSPIRSDWHHCVPSTIASDYRRNLALNGPKFWQLLYGWESRAFAERNVTAVTFLYWKGRGTVTGVKRQHSQPRQCRHRPLLTALWPCSPFPLKLRADRAAILTATGRPASLFFFLRDSGDFQGNPGP